jgi:hypothetical protein
MKKQTLRTSDECIQEVILVEGRDPQEPKKANSPISFEERPGKDVRETVPLARSIVHVSLWTLVVLMPAMLLLLGDIPLFLQMIAGTVGAMFWLLVIIPDDRLIRLRDSPFLTGPFSCWKRESGQDEKLFVRTSPVISSFGQVSKQAATAALDPYRSTVPRP